MKLLDFLWWFLDLDKSSVAISASKSANVQQSAASEPANTPDTMSYFPDDIEELAEHDNFFGEFSDD